MPTRPLPLDPEVRRLYCASMRPPPDTMFDCGVGTSYSLDLETALAVPLSLSFFVPESREKVLESPLATLEGLERNAERLAVFCDTGRILARTTPQSRLCALLEQMVIEVTAPQGGAFHPKVWVLRYEPLAEGGDRKLRLLILSRNLTSDQSWDLALQLDGTEGTSRLETNRPLVEFLRRLPAISRNAMPGHVGGLVDSLAESVDRAEWTLPQPFQSVSFAVNGFGREVWRPDWSTRMAIVSPFCDAAALKRLANRTQNPPRLVSRSEELDKVPEQVLAKFAEVSVMSDHALVDGEGEDDHLQSQNLSGLHAKAFIQEYGFDTRVTVGSGNATSPALLSGRNVEVFATLTGKRSRVGSIEEILGAECFGQLLEPYQANSVPDVDPGQTAAEARIERAFKELVGTNLKVRCESHADDASSDALWRLVCQSDQALELEGVDFVRVWPITRSEQNGVDALECLRRADPLEVAALPLADVTRFFAIHLRDESGKAEARFTLGFELEGLPPNRTESVVRSLVENREAFLRYLRLLLAELSDPYSAQIAARLVDAPGHGESWAALLPDEAVLEDMVRALATGRDRLAAIRRLIQRLEGSRAGETTALPPEFLRMWNSFATALDRLEKRDG